MSTDKYIGLPSKFEINEYRMMEYFIEYVEDEKLKFHLLNSIKGYGAFRRFKDAVFYEGIQDQWYAFREEQYREKAIRWCKDHDIPFT